MERFEQLSVKDLKELLNDIPDDYKVYTTLNQYDKLNNRTNWVDIEVTLDDIVIDHKEKLIRF